MVDMKTKMCTCGNSNKKSNKEIVSLILNCILPHNQNDEVYPNPYFSACKYI
jgi:hypothetical protein